jgi:hypothetical protein
MSLPDPDNHYDWHDERASWAEIKVALVLAGTVALGLMLLF